MNRFGRLSEDGREYVVTDPRPPRPWSNIISNERLGLAVSHTGSGFTWIDNSQLAVVNWWQQDFAQDTSGKFLYVRDRQSGQIWSLSPAPVWAPLDRFECRHGIGYTEFVTSFAGIEARWTLFPHATETIELWIVHLKNAGSSARSLDLTAYLEWCCGVTPAPRREFHKLFIETAFDPARHAVFGWNRMWDIGSKEWGHCSCRGPSKSARSGQNLHPAAIAHSAGFRWACFRTEGVCFRPEGGKNRGNLRPFSGRAGSAENENSYPSSTDVRNPTFTADICGLYQFRVVAREQRVPASLLFRYRLPNLNRRDRVAVL